MTSLSDPSGLVTYGYDDIDRVTSIAAPKASGSGTDTVTYSYDDNATAAIARKVTATYPGGALQRTHLNRSGRPALVEAKSAAAAALSTRTYAYLDGPTQRAPSSPSPTRRGARRPTRTRTPRSTRTSAIC